MTTTNKTLIQACQKAASALAIVFEEADLDGPERDEISHVRFICQQIEDGER